MKRSNAHEVTLRAVLGMLFMYLCPHLVRRQTLKSPRASHARVCMCAVNETARLCHSLTVGVDRYVFFRADTDTDYYRSSRPITDILNRYTCLV